MDDLIQIEKKIAALEHKLTAEAVQYAPLIATLHTSQQKSALNLVHYLALRNEDVRLLQDALHHAGLSSLASSESHILKQIQSIRQRLGAALQDAAISKFDYQAAQHILNKRTVDLFGFKKESAIPHIMVTLDSTFQNDIHTIRALLEAGMNVARINCAHDEEKDWQVLIETVRLASEKSGCPCKIYMDIAGPKMRVDLPGEGNEAQKLKVSMGQEIRLVEPGEKVRQNQKAISCYEKGVISCLKEGERIIIDDGKFEGIVRIKKGKPYWKITRISSKKSWVKKDKGFNLPDTVLDLPILTDADLKALPCIAAHADLAGCSFLRYPADLTILINRFKEYPHCPKLILKIETPEAVLNLPALLLAAMSEETFGVMIARGDLAVEIGFERLSEIQDEILWICEAANTPVIWATQVLETFSNTGIATRSEVTDAAHAAKAECVMLNKGAYIVETIQLLKKILNKSGGHRNKKRYSMRPLNIATHFLQQVQK